jgi:hypothetical protein
MPVTNHNEGETMSNDKYDAMRQDLNILNRVVQPTESDTVNHASVLITSSYTRNGTHEVDVMLKGDNCSHNGSDTFWLRVGPDTAQQLGLALIEAAAAARMVDKGRRVDALMDRVAAEDAG